MAEPVIRWTQDEWPTDHDRAGKQQGSIGSFLIRHGWLVRGLILGLAYLLFELTADAAVSTAAGCLELGRSDFKTAWWLRRTDPNRHRGRISARCYFAWAFLRVSLLSVAILFLVALVADRGPGPNGQPQLDQIPHIQGAAVIALGALLVAALQSFRVIVAAFWHRQPVWLGPEPRWARRQEVWPPSVMAGSKVTTNQARNIFYLGIAALAGPMLLVGVLSLGPGSSGILFCSLFGLVIVGIAVIMPLLDRRVLARSPAECWPLDGRGATPTLTGWGAHFRP